jgi:CubicO group peptidase (beta-lactamase class C family)
MFQAGWPARLTFAPGGGLLVIAAGFSARRLLIPLLMLLAAMGCSPSDAPPISPPSAPTPIDYPALEAEIESAITAGPATLDNVRAVLVNVDGETKIAHYRHGFTEDDHAHVFSVTKSVTSILIGIAIGDGLIANVDQPLAELLPEHRRAMSAKTAEVTLRQLMTMSGGFDDYLPDAGQWADSAKSRGRFVELLLARPQYAPDTTFWYSNPSAHLVAAILAAALERADGNPPRTILDYARERLFDPLGISTDPSFSQPLPDFFAPKFLAAGFGWGTDPNGIPLGAYGLRLAAPDMIKIGELYRREGVWNGRQIVPADWIRETAVPSRHNQDYGLLWWIIGEPAGAGYYADGLGGQRITVLPRSRAVIVYLSDVRVDSAIPPEDLEPLDDVFATAFLR